MRMSGMNSRSRRMSLLIWGSWLMTIIPAAAPNPRWVKAGENNPALWLVEHQLLVHLDPRFLWSLLHIPGVRWQLDLIVVLLDNVCHSPSCAPVHFESVPEVALQSRVWRLCTKAAFEGSGPQPHQTERAKSRSSQAEVRHRRGVKKYVFKMKYPIHDQ